MPITEIIAIVLGLVVTFGPKAMDIYAEWQAGIPAGFDPTPQQWAALKDKIAAHNPDTY